ncbi:GLPGLI family protein [Riemerella anatipestifer]|nr:GLPGLI family protein [Riemerella anatipestifer]MDY3532800.1 GLPGLI family protein [Riemerella anatipestifer]MDY3534645.1 GLPGLI family protein [Riemerella anatipestifer]
MKNLILKTLLLVLFGHHYFYGQSYKVIYEMKWKPSKNASEYKKELTALIINNKESSFFESYEKFRKDSLKTKYIVDYEKNGSRGPLRIPSSNTESIYKTFIIKNVLEKKISVEESFFAKTFKIDYYNCFQKWDITNSEPKVILGYEVKKATTNFGGRKWTAWFTPEIPIQDGPYKFYGLPGLILKISDNTNEYSFEIKGISKEENDLKFRNFGNGKPIEISPNQYQKFWKEYQKQPSMILENLNTEKTTYVIDGKDVNNKEVKDEYNRKEWEALKNFENPIELTPECK